MTKLTTEKLSRLRELRQRCSELRCEPGPTPQWGAYCGALLELRVELNEDTVGALLDAIDDPTFGDAYLEAIGDAIDNDLGWNTEEDRENGDYPARIHEVAAELRALKKTIFGSGQ